MTKKYFCDNCGKEIDTDSDHYQVFMGKVDVDENQVEKDLCAKCAQKLKKIIEDGFN